MFIQLKRDTNISLSKQIYRNIKEDILTGKIKDKEKLPSTRDMAGNLHVARNVVIEAYEQLVAEGFVETKNGAGTFVCIEYQSQEITKKISIQRTLTNHMHCIDSNTRKEYMVSFRSGIPDLTLIPIKKWAQIYQKVVQYISTDKMDYQSPEGDYSFRKVLANYLNRMRGTKTRPENIIITNGAAQSFHLLCKLITKNDYALVENPQSIGLLHTIKNEGVAVKGIGVDKEGLLTTDLPKVSPKLIFTTPSHQFPMGVILSASRRIELVKYARKNHVFIVEDDYDSEFRFCSNPIESMQSLAPDSVIYVGSFSKTLMPALRVGYMVLPDEIYNEVKEAKYAADIHSPILEQLTLSEMISSGDFERHIRRMSKQYKKKRDCLVSLLKEIFHDKVHIYGEEAGLHLVCSFEHINFNEKVLEQISKRDIEVTPVKYSLLETLLSNENGKEDYNSMLILGYGNTPIHKMESGLKSLYEILYAND